MQALQSLAWIISQITSPLATVHTNMVLALRLAAFVAWVALAATNFSQADALGFDNLNTTASDHAAQAAPRGGGKFEWKLHTQTERTFKNVDKDPADLLASARGGGTLTVTKDGILMMSGKGPRYYYVTAPSPVFLNVEMISYGRLTKTKSAFKDLVDLCQAVGYYSRMYFNTGEFAFQKEFYHSKQDGVTVYPKSRRKKLFDGGFHANKWIGMKYQVRTSDDGKSVHLRGFVDENETGEWKLVFETTDDGGWKANKPVQSKCGVKKDDIVLRPGSDSYFRTDDVEGFQWKKMEIRVL